MNVAVVEPTSTQNAAPAVIEAGPSRAGHQASEWIDPEGDDWFSSIYRELTGEPRAPRFDQQAPELGHWFG
jgi:hypothetical protein